MRDSRYDILFEPVQIGPVTARNRFFQVPHCSGMGHAYPKAEAAMRGIKAEGGWAVVSTQETEIHPSSDFSPYFEGRLWDEGDMKRMALMVDAVHAHDSLAAIEITHNGHAGSNRHSRLPSMAVSEMIMDSYDPVQAYAMTRKDIANYRRWHRTAALRSREIGFDIIYVYAGHDLSLLMHFVSRNRNRRTDEYGGCLENRVRLLREVLDDTRSCVGDTCGVALRFAVDELIGAAGLLCDTEGREVVEMLAEYPDIWDVNISDWKNDSQTSRFSSEGFQEPYTAFVKQVTGKPVVGVGRFTSPDTMVSQIQRGVLDMIGAARPSIADPFLPSKIEQGHLEDIRECIGCNICVSGDMTISPMRCTQNPTMAEEYRRNWHPERIAKAESADGVLCIGAGPAGLEAAMTLGKRGYRVVVAEALDTAGGRVHLESQLPGLAAWKRVADYRLGQVDRLDNVEIYLNSRLDSSQVLEFAEELDLRHVLCATGSRWDREGVGREHPDPVLSDGSVVVLTPDDIMSAEHVSGNAVVYDDDHYYMGGVIAEALARQGVNVSLATPAADVSSWTHNTLEQEFIEKRLHDIGVDIIEKHRMKGIGEGRIVLEHVASLKSRSINVDSVILVTARRPLCDLYFKLKENSAGRQEAGISSLTRIGDCLAPATIAAAVYAGHLYARDFDREIDVDSVPYRREYIEI